jgi:hypothetical protein
MWVSQRLWRLVPAERPSVTIQDVRIPSKRDLAENHSFTFITHGQTARIVTIKPGLVHTVVPHVDQDPPQPSRIVFSSPRRQAVRGSDLPAKVAGKRGDMTIIKFIPGGFVMDDGPCIGDAVAGELFFD